MKISEKLATILSYAREESLRTGNESISTDHLMLAMLRDGQNEACSALSALGIDLKLFKATLDKYLFKADPLPYEELGNLNFTKEAKETTSIAMLEAGSAKREAALPCDLLLAICRNHTCLSLAYLKDNGLSYDKIVRWFSHTQEPPQPKQRRHLIEVVVNHDKVFS